MLERKAETYSCDVMLDEIIVNGSEPIEPRRTVSPPISEEKKAFLDAIDQFQRTYTGRSLSWSEIFDVMVSLGYRKISPPANGDSQGGGKVPSDEKPT